MQPQWAWHKILPNTNFWLNFWFIYFLEASKTFKMVIFDFLHFYWVFYGLHCLKVLTSVLSSQTSSSPSPIFTVQVCRDTGRWFIVLLGCWAFGAVPFPVGWSPAGKSGRNQSNPMSLLYLSTLCANEQSEHTHTHFIATLHQSLCVPQLLYLPPSPWFSQYTCLFSNHLHFFLILLQAKFKHQQEKKAKQSLTAVSSQMALLKWTWPLLVCVHKSLETIRYFLCLFRFQNSGLLPSSPCKEKCRKVLRTRCLVISLKWDFPSKFMRLIGTEAPGRVTSVTSAHINLHSC